MEITEINREYMDDGKQEVVITLVAPVEDVAEASKRFFADLQKRELKGFRKGKAPRAVLEQSVGGHENAMGGVAEQLINDLAPAAIDQSGIIFIEEPDFNVDGLLVEDKPFKFTVSGPVAPVMRLNDYSPVSIEMPPERVTDSEIDAHLENLREYYHSFEGIDDEGHAAEMGDYVMCSITVTDADDKVVGGLAAQTRMIGLGDGSMPPDFDRQLVGSKAGETCEFDFDARNADGTSDYEGGTLHAVVDVKSFRKKVLPPLDDTLAIKVGCMDADDMRKQMERNIGIQKQRELPKLKVDLVVEEAIKRLDGEVPDYYIDFISQDVGREFMADLEKKGTNLSQWMLQNSIEGDAMKDEIRAEAAHRAKIDCALEAIFADQGLEVTDADIDAMFEGAEDNPDSHTREEWEAANRMSDLWKMARQTKATEWLVENALVTEVE